MRGWMPSTPGFLKLLWFVCQYVCVFVCVSVCPSLRALITSGVMWCDIGCARLVKQVSQLFPAFNYFIGHLPSITWMGVAILTQHVMNTCQKKLRWCGTSYKRITRETERFINFIKVSGRMHSDIFKRRPAFSFTVTISA